MKALLIAGAGLLVAVAVGVGVHMQHQRQQQRDIEECARIVIQDHPDISLGRAIMACTYVVKSQ